MLEQMDRWQRPNFRTLKNARGMGEIQFSAIKVHWRVFGFFDPVEKEFIVLGCGNHKGRVYAPKSIIKTCVARMREVTDDPRKAKRCVRPQ